MNALLQLQDWYFANCDEDWEHGQGVRMESLDNPGWTLSINLVDTVLEGVPFDIYEYGLDRDDHDWVHCKVKDKKFMAAGGPKKLEEMIEIFLAWSRGERPNNSCMDSSVNRSLPK